MTQIQLAEWEWPEEVRFLICTPLSHAGAAFFIPTLLQGGSLVVTPTFDPKLIFETIEKYKITATMLVPTMLYVLLDDPRIDDHDLSSLETVYYGAAAMSPTRLKEAIERFGHDLLPVLRAGRGADDPHRAAQGRAPRRRPGPARVVRPAGAVGAPGPAGRRGQRGGPGRARRDLRARAARHERLLEQARADRGGLQVRLAPHRRRRQGRRAGLPHDRRPQEGHDRLRRVQHLPPRGRGRPRHPRRGRPGRRGRRARRDAGARR